MKKMLLLINETGVPYHVMDFAVQLVKQEHYKLYGIFIGTLKPDDDSYPFPNDINLTDTDFTSATYTEEAEQLQQAQINVFENICKTEGVDFDIQIVRKSIIDTLIDETAFADMVLCDTSMRGWNFSMNNFISSAHCPVLLIPKSASLFKEIIFTYDGGVSSIHAIKQFTHMFPWCSDYKVYVVSVLPIDVRYMEYDALIREWILLHYPNSEIAILKGELKSEIAEFINARKDNLVVMGAFGRSSLSRIFKESLAIAVIDRTSAPVFISHT